MNILKCIDISKSYSDNKVLKNVNFSIDSNDFVSIIGKSGCGKSTLLHILGTILTQSSGSVVYNPSNTKPLVVFQDYGKTLYPWLNVHQNMQLVFSNHNQDKEDKIDYYLNIVGLEKEKNTYPYQLSGGMQQRVALARALSLEPEIILMDEPFGSIDSNTRRELELDLLRLWQKLKFSVIMITHDIDEAIFLSKRIFYLDGDRHNFTKEFFIDIDYPREHIETQTSKTFIDYKKEIMQYFLL